MFGKEGSYKNSQGVYAFSFLPFTSISSSKTPTETSESGSSNTELDWAQYYLNKQSPRLLFSKNNYPCGFANNTTVQNLHQLALLQNQPRKILQSIFQTMRLNSFYVIKTFPRETEAREFDSLTLIILLFHVGEIEFLSVNSFYCLFLLLSASSYNLFFKSCGSQTWHFTNSSYSIHFHTRFPLDSSSHSTPQIIFISLNERLDLMYLATLFFFFKITKK